MANTHHQGCLTTLLMWTIGLPITVLYYFIKKCCK